MQEAHGSAGVGYLVLIRTKHLDGSQGTCRLLHPENGGIDRGLSFNCDLFVLLLPLFGDNTCAGKEQRNGLYIFRDHCQKLCRHEHFLP